MNNEIKRRVFLTSVVGVLVGVPIGVRLFSGKKHDGDGYHFATTLKKFRSMSETTLSSCEGPSTFKMPLTPPVGDEWRYVFFSPAFLPDELSQAVNGDPDTFYAREGALFFDQTNRGQVVITGGDIYSGVVSPHGTEEKDKKTVSILLKDGMLRPAKSQNAEFTNSDIQLVNLLALSDSKDREFSVGTRWKGKIGRLKPFSGMPTDYEIVGFAKVGNRKTVNVAFSGKIANLLPLPGVNEAKPEKGAVSSLQYRGNAYFDLESGLLVRQEADLESSNSGIKGYKAKDGSNSVNLKSKFIVQLEQV